MFVLYGTGANGKSMFFNIIQNILGDCALSIWAETFMKRTNDIARLRGTRFVTTTEAERGRRLSEPLIKKITGNDRMTARFLYGEFFNFTPTFKIFMATNHKPVIKGTDYGIWRRIKLIPFTTRILDDNNEHAVSGRFFGLHLKEMGFEQGRTSEARFWCGLGLRA